MPDQAEVDLPDHQTYELASYDRNELYFNMQQLEYWDGRPEYKTLEEPAAEQGIDGQAGAAGREGRSEWTPR